MRDWGRVNFMVSAVPEEESWASFKVIVPGRVNTLLATGAVKLSNLISQLTLGVSTS